MKTRAICRVAAGVDPTAELIEREPVLGFE